jgi:hypothetical protein
MSPKSTKRSAARFDRTLKKANRKPQRPWAPPSILTAVSLSQFEGEPTVPLNRAIDFMAFGDARTPKNPLRQAYQRTKASRELCEAARTKILRLYGNPDETGDKNEKIPRRYFDMPRCLGELQNTLVTDYELIAKGDTGQVGLDFIAAREGRHQRWFNVRVKTDKFLNWIRELLPKDDKSPKAPNCKTWLIAQMRSSPQAKPKSKADFKRCAMNIFKNLTGRRFDITWTEAIEASGASAWAKPGAPKKK